MNRKLIYEFGENEIGYAYYDFLKCDKCRIYEDTEYAYHFILEVLDGGKKKEYDLYWDYGDEALNYIYDRFNLIMRVSYEKGLDICDNELEKLERFLVYLPEKEAFRIIVIALFKDGTKNIFFATPIFKYPKDKYMKTFDWKNCKQKIYMKRPYYVAINPFILPDLIENISSARDEVLELHLRFWDNKEMEIVLEEEEG